MTPTTPPRGRHRFRLALLASVAAGASLALVGELVLLAAIGRPAETSAAVPIIAVAVGAAGMVIAAVLARNEESTRRHAAQVHVIGDPAIDALDDDALLATLAGRLREVLGADHVAVLLASRETRHRPAASQHAVREFEVVAWAGATEGGATVIPATSFPASAPFGLHVRPTVPPGWASAGIALTEAVRGEGSDDGLVYVGWTGEHAVTAQDKDLVALAAGRVWSAVHRRRLVEAERRAKRSAEGARHQLTVLAEGGQALASALDRYEPEVAALAEVCVPAFADVCAIDLVDGAGALQPAARRVDPASGIEIPSGDVWRRLSERVLLERRTRFGFSQGGGTDDGLAEEARALLDASSIVIVPIHAGGLSMGTITMATGAGRRGFRSSDVSVAEDLASRLAVAVQRVLLHGEVVASADAQARAARRLRRLNEASITLAGMVEPERLLGAAASEARRVVQASAALVVHCPVDQPERRVWKGQTEDDTLAAVADAATASGSRVVRDGCLAAPLLDRHQVCRGALAVASGDGAEVDSDDEAALVSLAHLVTLVIGRAELTAAVRVREARMQALVDAAPLAILRLSPTGDVLDGNPAARQLFAWPDAAKTGPLPPSVAEALLELARMAAQGEATGDAVVQGQGLAGQPLDLSVAAAPVRDDSGWVDAVLLVVADVSERRKLERQLQQAQRLEAMAQVAGGVAHDFNNLLTVIVGYTEALLAAVEDDDPTRPLLESIDRAGASAAALTNQLLGLAGRRAAMPLPVELGALVRSFEPMVRRLVGVDVDVVIDVAPSGSVVVDPAGLEQVVLNLAINARDAMPSGGRLEISVTPVDLGPADADRHRLAPGPYVQLSVADTGTGMDDETLARCFEPFFTRKERGRGTGLGLAGVYAAATEWGGAITVSSRQGEGTTFRVLLPRSDHEATAPVEAAKDERPTGTGRVLLVEDEDEIRELARQTLVDSGFTVVAAANAASAIAAFEQSSAPFDVLVSDIVMPGMRGTELAGLLLERQPTLQVLYVSGYAGVGLESGDTIDGVAVLRKPFRSHDLCGRVVTLAERARAVSSQGSNR